MKFINFFKKTKLFFLFLFICFSLFFSANKVLALNINVIDKTTFKATWNAMVDARERETVRLAEKKADAAMDFSWADLLMTTAKGALDTLAIDTAIWIGSGGKGQKPLFITESWGEYLTNIADNAAGTFLEGIGKEWKFDLCDPGFAVKMKIGLGLYETKVKPPKCTFTSMKDNWDEAIHDENFLNDFQDMFDPASNDLSIALGVQTKIIEDQNFEILKMTKMREESKGWLDLRDLADRRIGVPGYTEYEFNTTFKKVFDAIDTYTGNLLVDSAGVFINQLAITGMKTLMKELVSGGGTYTNPFDWSSLTNFNAQPYNGGVDAMKEKARKIIEPIFNTRGDYNILAELSICPEIKQDVRVGTTNCVITDKFKQAVQKKSTVGNAMREGYLQPDYSFGFDANGGEPDYKQGYPYRSMVILRKYRIIPVGWELAAQYIKENDVENTLGDMVACFDPGDDYEGYSQDWCEGMIDPNWVLKAPQNYCRKEGPGPQIMSYNVNGEYEESELSINRNDTYCADNWGCIQEKDDGTCKYYGYCTEEKRGWKFDAESCEPKYNTCQSYRKRDGQTLAILENTIDYRYCNISNVGCTAYSTTYSDYLPIIDYVDWNGVDNIYFDKDAKECDESNEGCHEFIRLKAGIGANILRNGSFEDFAEEDIIDDLVNDNFADYGNTIGRASSDSYDGMTSLWMPAIRGPISFPGFISLAGEEVTLSLYAKDCGANSRFSIGQSALVSTSTNFGYIESDGWVRYAISYSYPAGSNNIVYGDVTGSGDNCKVDAVKIEFGDEATTYTDYREAGLVYQKLLPGYLEEECYYEPDGEGFVFEREDAPAKCDNFTRKCTEGEVGCQLYTSQTDGFTVPAKIGAQDACPAECVGFDQYLQSETFFEAEDDKYFIPKTAQKCNAQQVGCDEFTNLDEVDQGGEGIEYYTYLRQCRNPDEDCSSFYTWEGSAETGYQLKIYNLQKDDDDGPYLTNLGQLNGQDCVDSDDYNLETNSACREFYSRSGEVFYRFYPYTVTCSEDCHPLRRTAEDTQESCEEDHNGEWIDEACIYMAIPSEGIKCSANQVGCREYSGNAGNNKRLVSQSNFEGSTQGWEGAEGLNTTLSSESLMMGGNSLRVSGFNNRILLEIGNAVLSGKNYVVQFIAKAVNDDNPSLRIAFYNTGVPVTENFEGRPTIIQGEWRSIELNLPELVHEVDGSEHLEIQGSGDFYIDDIKLIEITDRYYLIKDSWTFPMHDDANHWCEWDLVNDRQENLYSLGCDAYRAQDNSVHYLHQFSKLCPESSAGCELMLDTHNYSDYNEGIWNDEGDPGCGDDGDDCIQVPGDYMEFVVYNKDKKCNVKDKGCSRLGKEIIYDNQALYNDAYAVNNPDLYNEILCTEEAVHCEEWASQDSVAYFKDPGDQVCDWRQVSNQTDTKGWGWYKKKIKRCDDGAGDLANDGVISTDGFPPEPIENNICLSNLDCGTGGECTSDDECGALKCVQGECRYDCILDANDYACPIDPYKTIGIGGPGNAIDQPTIRGGVYWAGLCPASEAGCAEYIDPISNFNANLISNSKFRDLNNDENITSADGWGNGAGDYQYRQDNISISPNTLYRFGGKATAEDSITLNCGTPIYRLNRGNTLRPVTNTFRYGFNSEEEESVLLYLPESNEDIVCNLGVSDIIEEAILKKAIVDYRLKQEINKEECNGIVNYGDGCVLFDERVQSGSSLASLNYDADLSPNDSQTASVCEDMNCDSNTILKVSPDRDCNSWLDCRMYTVDANGDPICWGLGECSALDDNGVCNGFVGGSYSDMINQLYSPGGGGYFLGQAEISNKTGYVKIGYVGTSGMNDLYPFSSMDQEGDEDIIKKHAFNGSFEEFIEDSDELDENLHIASRQPVGWSLHNGDAWNKEIFNVISDPVTSQNKNIEYNQAIYAPDGKSYLAFSTEETWRGPKTTDFVSVSPNTDYIISAWINTQDMYSLNPDFTVSVYMALTPFDGEGNEIIVPEEGIRNNELRDPETDELGRWVRHVLYAPSGADWALYTNKFTTGPAVQSIKIRLSGSTDGEGGGDCSARVALNCQGNAYVDDIKIAPALHVRNNNDNPGGYPLRDEYTTQTCRLYPDDDSLSCDYYEDSGIRKKGWWGYCLEYDSHPGDDNACLQWWPVDRVMGDNFQTEESMSYDGRFPMYYCLEDEEEIIYEYRHAYWATTGCENRVAECDAQCAGGYTGMSIKAISSCDGGCGGAAERFNCYCYPNPTEGAIYDGSPNSWISDQGFPMFQATLSCDKWQITSATDGWHPTTDFTDHTLSGPLRSNEPAPSIQGVITNNSVICDGAPFCRVGSEAYRAEFSQTVADNIDGLATALGVAPEDLPRSYCTEMVQTVTPAGGNMYWQGRVNGASEYLMSCDDSFSINPYNNGVCTANEDYIYFGSMVYPTELPSSPDDPGSWDSKTGAGQSGQQPIYFESIEGANPGQPRAGALHDSEETVKRIFANSYSVWEMSTNCVFGGDNFPDCARNAGYRTDNYQMCDSENSKYDCEDDGWGPPTEQCPGNVRPAWDSGPPPPAPFAPTCGGGNCMACDPMTEYCDFCGVVPEIENVRVEDKAEDVFTNYDTAVEISFNSIIDINQLPLKKYTIDFGDGNIVPYDEQNISSKPDPEDPHSISYRYIQQQVLEFAESIGNCRENCTDFGSDEGGYCCRVKPRIKIEDNWGWCNEGETGDPCPAGAFESFPSWIILRD